LQQLKLKIKASVQVHVQSIEIYSLSTSKFWIFVFRDMLVMYW
jgi:hypothetical protein